MSCENPPGSTEAAMPRRRKFDKTGICIKCKISPGRLVIRHAVYCKDCFLALITSKFRHVLDPCVNSSDGGVRGALKASGNLMIGFSGGIGSTVLLDLVKTCYFSPEETGKSRGGKKHPRKSGRVWERVVVCYVECGEGLAGARDRTQDIKAAFEKYEDLFEFHPVRLEEAFDGALLDNDRHINVDLSREDLPISTSGTANIPPVELLKTYLASLPTLTSQQSAVASLSRLLLQYAARSHGCSHLLLGTSLTSLSVNLIDAVASGAGFTLGMEKGEEWQGNDGSEIVRVVRPLREVSLKECAAYTRWKDLSVIGNERMLSRPANVKESIGALTKEFIFGLERDYPSTVSAIVRTCDKLVSNTEGDKCILCEKPAQKGVREWKERISIRTMSGESDGTTDSTPQAANLSTESLAPRLCYGCHTTLTSRSSRGARRTVGMSDGLQSVRLPTWVGRNIDVDEQRTRAGLKSQIQEFLLDEDEDGS